MFGVEHYLVVIDHCKILVSNLKSISSSLKLECLCPAEHEKTGKTTIAYLGHFL